MRVSKISHDDFAYTKWPPGFRFHPNDDELVLYYLKRKICRRRLRDNVIGELDVYKWDPEELPAQSMLKTGDRQWFFFSHRDRRYPNGGRVNRATRHGYWKATGKDRNVISNNRTVGVKKTLVFYKGRAPSGERTDWVMHEYTMPEEELQRCPTRQDPCALYKVYKKSGPGPKNGEQYGATFREDEWADEDDPVDAVPINGISSADRIVAYDQGQLPESDVDEIFGQIVDDPIINQPRINDFTHGFPQVGGEEEMMSTMVDSSLGEAISVEPRIVLHPGGQHSVAQASFEVTLSATNNMYSCDGLEVTSASTISEQPPQEEEADYLEINDLSDPEPTTTTNSASPQLNGTTNSALPQLNGTTNSALPQLNGGGYMDSELHFPGIGNDSENLHLQERDGWDGHDVYFDAVMFLQDLGSDQGMVPSHIDDTDNISSELWTHEQRPNIFASPGSEQVVVVPPTSGFAYAGSSTNILVEARQNQGGNEKEPQNYGNSSTLWGFLESIPTTPAFASESAFINRAFDRMPSFGRVRINPVSMDAAATGDGTSTGRRAGGSRGFSFLPVLGMTAAAVLMLSVAVKVYFL
ncbi:NAC domain-containing protein 17-like [Macadamia integrifolia]|uniref:NAC domain-containing protein 17-like n=1 Tax=Macadamia integrifolia TaxID=60698 RepID=UPI001C4F0030|nr:NAC domain-containing protein 17-like [Macadamia integrifolia]